LRSLAQHASWAQLYAGNIASFGEAIVFDIDLRRLPHRAPNTPWATLASATASSGSGSGHATSILKQLLVLRELERTPAPLRRLVYVVGAARDVV
jgi:hypothetical protein